MRTREQDEHRINAECARLEAHTAREQASRRHNAEGYGGTLVREAIRVWLAAGIQRGRIVATLREVANDVSHGREIRRID